MKETLVGLVIRTVETGEHGKYLTLLTANGKRYLSVSGARGMKSRFVAISQLFCYAEYQVEVKNGRTYLQDASRIESFYEIYNDPLKLSLASYACELAQQVCMENNDESQMFSLLLNVLYVLVTSSYPADLIKAVFEARMILIQGIAPELTECRDCGKEKTEPFYLDVMNGSVVCADCLFREDEQAKQMPPIDDGTARILLPLAQGVRQAFGYVLACLPKRLFAFQLDPSLHEDFARVTETYLKNQLECHTVSLQMYQEMKKLENGTKGKEPHETGKL